ncbi:outer membrane lipoprotein-sorting protein [Gilvimarinus sp. 2_MG-2023]|uniref:outer membrane lipoprotein-sorting protein n=1 Tax=Gilvimarinus sp. 2_MG-2023 TaxID=3062666 RepID=UPI0026E2D527|nr:outer membrane lipoprotein-sorting protein [Gilvimarinus sp. 2_MG-2023]MDO6569315.1 outer membrane lipoprotein-sorting protein [Gilvimarinus sp. 2_MG-2023]
MMSRYTACLLMLTLSTGAMATASAATMTAREIAVKSDTRYTGDSSRADAQLILIDRKGRERVRDIRTYTLDNAEMEKSISFFVSPTDVAGTTYMNYDYEDGRDDDSWLYLPALKQVRRVAAGDKSGSFMGSDFTYSDINGVNTDWYNYTMLDANAEVDGVPVWKIESTPKPEFADKVEGETGYIKSHLWIRKDNFVQVQGQIWTERKGWVKFFSAQQLEEIDGIWTPLRLQMISVRNNEKEHASVFQFSNYVYNQHTDEELFTTQSMQRGIQ